MDDMKKAQCKKIGPGGRKCSCCFQPKNKKKIRRIGRRVLKNSDKKTLNKGE
jgi:hypothetical protein